MAHSPATHSHTLGSVPCHLPRELVPDGTSVTLCSVFPLHTFFLKGTSLKLVFMFGYTGPLLLHAGFL